MYTPNLRRDLPASLVVFLVAVPLSLGIALASDAPIIAGLIGAIAGGIVTGLLAGSPLQVSGPAAGLTVVVAGFVQQFGWETMCLITACAGVLQFVLGYFKVARGALMIAPSVVHGMLAGIGITIAIAQLHVVLGGSPASSPIANLLALPARLGEINLSATLLGLMTIALLFIWKRMKNGTLKAIPGALVAVASATVVSIVLDSPVARVDLPDTFTFTAPTMPTDWSPFLIAVVTVALIASVESLLCAVATDKLHTGVRSNLDKELSAQGAGNFVSGLILLFERPVRVGDVITVGHHALRFVDSETEESQDEFEKTMVIRPGSASAAVAAAKAGVESNSPPPTSPPQPAPSAPVVPPGLPLGRIQVLNGPIAGKQLELTKALITLGKPGVQVAVISRRPQGYFLTHIEGDGKSMSFPIVNGTPIGAQAYAIKSGDVIELAGIKMEFSLIS